MMKEKDIHKVTQEDASYPNLLKQIKNPPEVLYAIGNVALLNTNCIAVVGARKCSEYGEKTTKLFTKELVKNNITIVSGMAIGIDSIAHNTAINNNGRTIAVLRRRI